MFFLVINRENEQVNNYIKSINTIPKILINGINNLLILRNDLCFIQDLDYSRISKDKILTQWNLFHSKSEKEMPDQIQFIGASLVNKFVNKINTNRIDTQWTGSLHNFYNYCVKHFGEEQLSYLNYIEDPHPDKDRGRIKGNPSKKWGNPLYNYTRYMK